MVCIVRDLLSRLFQFDFAPLETGVDGVAEDGNFRVQLVILPIVELGLEAVGFGPLQFIELLVDLEQHVLHFLRRVDPDGREHTGTGLVGEGELVTRLDVIDLRGSIHGICSGNGILVGGLQ